MGPVARIRYGWRDMHRNRGLCHGTSTQPQLLGAPMELPMATQVSVRLIGGSLLFGIGWGLAGFCPGPAIVAAGSGQSKAWIFLFAMLGGMALFSLSERRTGRAAQTSVP
jgi:uncharacterized membrane protein YedE/YeeE